MNALRRGYTTDKDLTLQTCEAIVLDENLSTNLRPSVWHLDYIALKCRTKFAVISTWEVPKCSHLPHLGCQSACLFAKRLILVPRVCSIAWARNAQDLNACHYFHKLHRRRMTNDDNIVHRIWGDMIYHQENSPEVNRLFPIGKVIWSLDHQWIIIPEETKREKSGNRRKMSKAGN